jgi:thymidylate kinase
MAENIAKPGKMITIYGVNGIGKSTQIALLVDKLIKKGYKVRRLKYPIYDLESEGPIINKYLRDPEYREKNPMTTHELQKLYAQNRERFEPTLKKYLEDGEIAIVEDYTFTGIVWGMVWGGDPDYLKEINRELYKEDLAILMDGERFMGAIEANHRNETDSSRIDQCRKIFLQLADDYGCVTVNANQTVEKVAADIWDIVSNTLEREE